MEYITVKVCVCAINADGEPDIYFVKVRLLWNDFNYGEHLALAEQQAVTEGYSSRSVSWDEYDYLFKCLNCDEKFVWDSATTIGTVE